MSRFADIHATLAIKRSMEVRREEYLDHMTFQTNMRPLFTEIFGPLIGLREEWQAQGTTAQELDFSAFRYRRPMWQALPVNTGWLGDEEEHILEETPDHIIARDYYGRTVKLIKSSATLPLPLDHPVRNMDDWLRIKHHYAVGRADSPSQLFHGARGQAGSVPSATSGVTGRAERPSQGSSRGGDGRARSPSQDSSRGDRRADSSPYIARLGEGWEQMAQEAQREGRIVTVSIPGGFDEPRQLMGEEALCVAFYEQPELIHDMLNTIGEMAARVLEHVSSVVQIDQLDVHEDFAGKSGPLIGPKQINEFIRPYYRRVWDMLVDRGARVFCIDSDGDINTVIPALLDAGINTMLPMEPAAGMDIVQVRRQYGNRLAFIGGIDKHVLRRGQAEISAELEYKLPAMVRSGGCILGLDHRIPNGTPLANYRFYIDKVWEILERDNN